jgi:hypothetical protein
LEKNRSVQADPFLPSMTLADRAQGKDSKSEKTRMVMGALSEPREVGGVEIAASADAGAAWRARLLVCT